MRHKWQYRIEIANVSHRHSFFFAASPGCARSTTPLWSPRKLLLLVHIYHGVPNVNSVASAVRCNRTYAIQSPQGYIATLAGLCSHPCPFGTGTLWIRRVSEYGIQLSCSWVSLIFAFAAGWKPWLSLWRCLCSWIGFGLWLSKRIYFRGNCKLASGHGLVHYPFLLYQVHQWTRKLEPCHYKGRVWWYRHFSQAPRVNVVL